MPLIDVFKVSVVVSLTNQVSGVLGLIARDFAKTDAQAVALKTTLKEIKFLGMSGLILGGLGFAGLKLTQTLVKPASEYLHQLNIMNMAGLTHAEIAQSVGDAWKNTSTVITTTATENLRMLLDLRNVIAEVNAGGLAPGTIGMGAAQAQLPVLSMIRSVLASSSEAGVKAVTQDNFAFSVAKALDIIGAASSPERFAREAGEMAKVITAFQGRVTPQQFQSVFQYARQAKYGLSDEFKYEILPSLMLEYASGSASQGGGSRGVGPSLAAFNRFWVQGLINKKSMPELASLGLLNPGSALRTTTQGTTVGPLKGADLALSNPFKLVQEVLMPAIEKKFGGQATQAQIIQEINTIGRGNQLATQIMMEFALKASNFLRDQKIIQGADDYRTAYGKAMRDDPEFAYGALGAQWTNLKTALGITIVPSIVQGLMALTRGLNEFATFLKDHENIARGLTWSFIGLSTAMAFGGTVLLLTAAFRGLYAVLTIGGLIPALTRITGLAGGAASALGLVATVLSRLAGPGAFIAGMWPKSTQLPGADREPYGGKSMSERFPGLVVPNSVPLGRVPSGSVLPAPAPAAQPQGKQQSSVYLDGRQVGMWVQEHLADHLNRPATGTNGVDPRIGPQMPGVAGNWAPA